MNPDEWRKVFWNCKTAKILYTDAWFSAALDVYRDDVFFIYLYRSVSACTYLSWWFISEIDVK